MPFPGVYLRQTLADVSSGRSLHGVHVSPFGRPGALRIRFALQVASWFPRVVLYAFRDFLVSQFRGLAQS